VLSIATSIDALAMRVSFGILRTLVLKPALIISIVCYAISFTGVILGEQPEDLLGKRMEITGGLSSSRSACRSLWNTVFGEPGDIPDRMEEKNNRTAPEYEEVEKMRGCRGAASGSDQCGYQTSGKAISV